MQGQSSWSRARAGEWALGTALLASYPASFLLPGLWAHEGGLLESLQVVVVLAGAMLALRYYLRTRPAHRAMLALWATPVWLILAGRELSWGRAWLQQPGFDAAGRAVAETPQWLQSLAWPCAAVLLAWLLYSAWHYRIDELVRAALARRTPWLCLAVALGAAMGSTCAEGHMSCSMDLSASHAQLFEELCELVAYMSLCMIQHVVLLHLSGRDIARPVAPPIEAKPEEVR